MQYCILKPVAYIMKGRYSRDDRFFEGTAFQMQRSVMTLLQTRAGNDINYYCYQRKQLQFINYCRALLQKNMWLYIITEKKLAIFSDRVITELTTVKSRIVRNNRLWPRIKFIQRNMWQWSTVKLVQRNSWLLLKKQEEIVKKRAVIEKHLAIAENRAVI